MKSAAPAAISQEPTSDLNSEALGVLSNLMVAQAQELFVVKAIKDGMKDLIIAKLACQCEELYADVLRGLQKESLRGTWEKEWISIIAGKQAGFDAITQLYHSLDCRTRKVYGEEISRLQRAVELFKIAQSRSGRPHLYDEYASRAQRNLIESKKDNDFIYNEIIPDVKTLEPPGKFQPAKAINLAPKLGSKFKDLFGELVPVALHQAMSACDARKNEIVNAEVMKLREATQGLNGLLASLNLPAAIEKTDSGSGLPPSLLEKANEVREKGGVESIRSLIKELPESLNRNREILDESERMLNEERDSDNQLRGQFREKWTRTPSDKLTEMFRSNCGKYREIINNAVQADKVVREKFDTNSNGMEILSKNPNEIHQSIPSGGGDAIANSSAVQKLRQLMDAVETVKVERDVIESELKAATVNMKDEFLQALAQDGAINEPALSVAQIGKTLSPLQNQVKESIERQQTLVSDIQAAHAQFSSESGVGTGSRETLFVQLAASYDSFTELQNNLKEGTKFYNDLTQLLIVFQSKISDYCFARKTEKEELMKDLTQQTSRQAPNPTPNVPSHYPNNPIDSTTPNRPAPAAPQPAYQQQPGLAYPVQVQGMPVPYGATSNNPYPAYVPPPMPQSFNPYATLPYPNSEWFFFDLKIFFLFLFLFISSVRLSRISTRTTAELWNLSRCLCSATTTTTTTSPWISSSTTGLAVNFCFFFYISLLKLLKAR